MLTSFKAKVAAAAAPIIAMGGLALAISAGPANATTLTCTNVASALIAPFGCGGLQSTSTAHGTLDLAHTSNTYNALVTVQTDASVTSEDWTVFAENGNVTGGIGGLGEYVAMDTPNGFIPQWTDLANVTHFNSRPAAGQTFFAGANDLCLSVEHATIGGKYRWFTVLRNCNTNGKFTYGTPTASGAVSFSFANRFQLWAPINTQDQGLAFDNVWLHNHANVNYLLDIQGAGGAGSRVLAWPQIGSAPLWEQWDVIGCTAPASILPVPSAYVNCP